MTINFFEPGDIPQPQEKVRIERLDVQVAQDRWRVKIEIDLTPFQVRPNVGVVLVQDLPPGITAGVVADMTIIETMHNKMEFTMHIRGKDDPQGNYVLKTRLYYDQNVHEPADEREIKFGIPSLRDIPNIDPDTASE